MLDHDDWLLLAQVPGFGAAACGALLRDGRVGDLGAAEVLQRARRVVPAAALATLRQRAKDLQAELLTPACAAYPQRLQEIHDPPPLLFVRGSVEALRRPQLAVVGSRRASRRALLLARQWAAELVAAGFIITSGLARGVDAAAHEGALGAAGETLAVLGHGIDRIYPSAHRALAQRVVDRGALVSEFAPGTPALPAHFPRRNRLVSGLSLGVLVVEAAERSGSLITARLASEQGRDVFAVPGVPTDVGMRGCHRLIQQGAKLVTCPEDILEDYAERIAVRPGRSSGRAFTSPPLSPLQQRILAAMDSVGTDFDALARCTGVAAAPLSAELVQLELLGVVVREGALFVPLAQRA